MTMRRPGLGQWLIYGFCRLALGFLRLLPLPAARFLTHGGGKLAWRLLKRHRRIARINLGIAFPALSEKQQDRIARDSFAHLGELLVWIARLPALVIPDRLSRIVRYEGFEHYRQAKEAGRPILFLTAHLGPWELLSFSHGVFSHPVHFIMRPLDFALFDRFMTRRRTLSGCVPILKQDALRKVTRVLSEKGEVGILIDQKVQEKEGVFVEFFGRPACMAVGPAGIARVTGAAVIPAFIAPDPSGQAEFIFRLEGEIPLQKTSDRRADDAVNTQRFAAAIEGAVRAMPDWWMWGHRRWHTRPAGTPDPYESIRGSGRRARS